MNEYRIEYTYIEGGEKMKDIDYIPAFSAQKAVDWLRQEYSDLEKFCIKRVYIDCGTHWGVIEEWN